MKTNNKKNLCLPITLVASSVMLTAASLGAQDADPVGSPEQFLLDDGDGPARLGNTSDGKRRFEIRAGYAVIEGDIVLGKVQSDGELETSLQTRGIGRDASLDRWPDGIVYYQLSDTLNDEDSVKAREAVAHWNTYSSISMVERTEELQESISDYINFEPSGGCASWVGQIGGEQAVWIGPTCTAGSVVHEIGHAIGLFHEHTRSDRDSFIAVNWNNILDGKDFNFDIMEIGASDLGDYDYGSIMHYGPRFFSKNGEETITGPDGQTIGQRDALSTLDLASVNDMYGTDLTLASSTVSDANNTQINVSINNIGLNGAHAIEYRLPLTGNMTAKSFSGNGWSCAVQSSDIVCELSALAETSESTLAVIVDPSSADPDQLEGYLSSKTFDTDLSNNGVLPADHQQAGVEAQELSLGAATADENSSETGGSSSTVGGGTSIGITTGTGNGNPLTTSESETATTSGTGDASSNTTASTGSANTATTTAANSSGGSGAPWPGLLLLMLALMRRGLRIKTPQR